MKISYLKSNMVYKICVIKSFYYQHTYFTFFSICKISFTVNEISYYKFYILYVSSLLCEVSYIFYFSIIEPAFLIS